MLGNRDVAATIAVRNLDAARRFYESVLGLKPEQDVAGGAVVYKSGRSTLLVYVSRYAGTNQATSATWDVGADLEEIVKNLKSKGVSFEHYDLPGTTRDGDIHYSGSIRNAWLKDPDGNILSLVSEG